MVDRALPVGDIGRWFDVVPHLGSLAYRAASPDPRCHLIDLGDAARTSVVDVAGGKPARRSYDGLHPDAPMHERLGVMVADEVRRTLSGR